jgi:hypothetical protein
MTCLYIETETFLRMVELTNICKSSVLILTSNWNMTRFKQYQFAFYSNTWTTYIIIHDVSIVVRCN